MSSSENSIFATKFRNFGVVDRPTLFQSFGFVTNSFGDLVTRIESYDRENFTKNTVGPNEFTDFEKFKVEHRRRPKTISWSNSAQQPGTGITLQLTPHTTAVTHTSAGGVHWQESSPSRPSTLINLKLKLPPSAPIHARTVLHNPSSDDTAGLSSNLRG